MGNHDDGVGRLIDAVLQAPWGTLSRAQLDYLLFELLVREGRIDLADRDFDIANTLRTTVTRARALRYRYEQETLQGGGEVSTLISAQSFVFEGLPERAVRVQFQSRYLRSTWSPLSRGEGRSLARNSRRRRSSCLSSTSWQSSLT